MTRKATMLAVAPRAAEAQTLARSSGPDNPNAHEVQFLTLLPRRRSRRSAPRDFVQGTAGFLSGGDRAPRGLATWLEGRGARRRRHWRHNDTRERSAKGSKPRRTFASARSRVAAKAPSGRVPRVACVQRRRRVEADSVGKGTRRRARAVMVAASLTAHAGVCSALGDRGRMGNVASRGGRARSPRGSPPARARAPRRDDGDPAAVASDGNARAPRVVARRDARLPAALTRATRRRSSAASPPRTAAARSSPPPPKRRRRRRGPVARRARRARRGGRRVRLLVGVRALRRRVGGDGRIRGASSSSPPHNRPWVLDARSSPRPRPRARASLRTPSRDEGPEPPTLRLVAAFRPELDASTARAPSPKPDLASNLSTFAGRRRAREDEEDAQG